MTQDSNTETAFPVVEVEAASEAGDILLVCEHASNAIPPDYGDMGLSAEERRSHIAWDPGALELSRLLAAELHATLVRGCVSRLIYDCNRPPDAPGAMPIKAETTEIPGNQNLTAADRAARVAQVYIPFHTCLAEQLKSTLSARAFVTIHSFTPIYHGKPRAVEIGILHGNNPALAQAMMSNKPDTPHVIELNQPYGPADGVDHTLNLHGNKTGLHNVMIEVRNDLLQTPAQQTAMADLLAPWITIAMKALKA